MRIHKVINRVYEGTVYYRWVLNVPPKNVRELGWVDGQQLETVVRGSSMWIQPSSHPRPGRREVPFEGLLEEVQRRGGRPQGPRP